MPLAAPAERKLAAVRESEAAEPFDLDAVDVEGWPSTRS